MALAGNILINWEHNPLTRIAMNIERRIGIYLFFVSVCLATQINWVIRHEQYDSLLTRSSLAIAVGVALTRLAVYLVEAAAGDDADITVRKLSLILTPGLLFLFFPFHSLALCRWRYDCNYADDVFIVLPIAISLSLGTILAIEHRKHFGKDKIFGFFQSLIPVLQRHGFWIAWFLACVVLVVRGWDRFIHPEPFAEGAKQFIGAALNDGWISLTHLYDGFLHTVPRLIALVAVELMPIKYIPHFTVTVCYMIAAATTVYIVRDCFRWIIPSDFFRFVFGVVLCLVPGLIEVLGNLPNIHYLLFILLGLMALQDIEHEFRSWELATAGLIVLSTGMSVVFLPLALVRVVWLMRYSLNTARPSIPYRELLHRHRGAVIFFLIILTPSVLLMFGQLLGAIPQAKVLNPVTLEIADLFIGLQNIFVVYFVLHPFAGTVVVTEIIFFLPLFVLFIVFLPFLSILSYRLYAEHRPQLIFISVWLLGILLIPVMIFFFRPSGFALFMFDKEWHSFGWWMRYNYIFSAAGVLLWLMVLRPKRPMKPIQHRTVVTWVILLSYVFQAQYYFNVGRYGQEAFWSQTSDALRQSVQTGCPRTVVVRAHPDPNWWNFTYHSPKSNLRCE